MADSANLPWFLHNRRLTEYDRGFGVCKVGNQSHQLPALTENRYQAEQQQLAEMRGVRYCNACGQYLCRTKYILLKGAPPTFNL